jgi:RNA polymerase sigma-70 factor (ECF subfamily)
MIEVHKLNDDELMLDFQNGNDASFNDIVRKFKTPLANFVFRFLGNYEDSLDIVQETFIRVYKNRLNYKNITKFSTWIYTIAANLAKTELRRRRRFTFFRISSVKGPEEEYEFNLPDTAFSPDIETDKILRSKIIQNALNKLSLNYREVIILRDIMELSYEEISVITRLREGTVKSRINRGRAILQELLKDIHNEK